MKRPLLLTLLISSSLGIHSLAADAPKPLKILLITGGCCHDYAQQKDLLKAGLEARANVVVDHAHSPDRSMKPPLPILGNPDYAKGYDLVIHDECAVNVDDPAIVKGVLQPHLDGIPGVNLHCGIHSYRIGNPNDPITDINAPHAFWFQYLGLQSSGHGRKTPIAISFADAASPITKGLAGWETGNEELYNNVQILTAKALAKGKQGDAETVVAWTNEYGPKKTRVFSTTIGHTNETVADPRYLDLVVRGVLWATGKLNDDGTPSAGYGPPVK